MEYLVVEHSITCQTNGRDENGDDHRGDDQRRHWLRGSVVELNPLDAKSLLASGAVEVFKKNSSRKSTDEELDFGDVMQKGMTPAEKELLALEAREKELAAEAAAKVPARKAHHVK